MRIFPVYIQKYIILQKQIYPNETGRFEKIRKKRRANYRLRILFTKNPDSIFTPNWVTQKSGSRIKMILLNVFTKI